MWVGGGGGDNGGDEKRLENLKKTFAQFLTITWPGGDEMHDPVRLGLSGHLDEARLCGQVSTDTKTNTNDLNETKTKLSILLNVNPRLYVW